MKQKCSVCNWFEIDTEDPLVEAVKKAHKQSHTIRTFKDGGKRNNIIGEVRWITYE